MNSTFTLFPVLTLTYRELVRFYRQPSRVVGALGSPLLFWFLLGSGLGNSFRSSEAPQGMGYLEYFFPGTIVLVILFTAIFSTISIIEDRREGFMQSVLVAPVSRLGIVGGKVLGGTLLATLQGMLFLCLAPLVGFELTLFGILEMLLAMFLLSFTLTSLGFIFAWKLNSVQGFHGVMNLVLIPMWLLSGALFPMSGAPLWLKIVMYLNPLTYGVVLVRTALYSKEVLFEAALPFAPSFLVTVFFSVIFYALATLVVSKSVHESPT
jgi:ABC-2 type transport system permease protein